MKRTAGNVPTLDPEDELGRRGRRAKRVRIYANRPKGPIQGIPSKRLLG